jgi:hypothetical protein
MHAGQDRADFRCATRADHTNGVTGPKLYLHLAPRYIGCAVKNINSFFYRDRLNAQSLLKKVRAEACRYASKNLVKFRFFNRAQHTNGFGFTAIDSSAND